MEGDFCCVLVAVSGGGGEHPWCSTVKGSIQLDRYVRSPSLFPHFPHFQIGQILFHTSSTFLHLGNKSLLQFEINKYLSQIQLDRHISWDTKKILLFTTVSQFVKCVHRFKVHIYALAPQPFSYFQPELPRRGLCREIIKRSEELLN